MFYKINVYFTKYLPLSILYYLKCGFIFFLPEKPPLIFLWVNICSDKLSHFSLNEIHLYFTIILDLFSMHVGILVRQFCSLRLWKVDSTVFRLNFLNRCSVNNNLTFFCGCYIYFLILPRIFVFIFLYFSFSNLIFSVLWVTFDYFLKMRRIDDHDDEDR